LTNRPQIAQSLHPHFGSWLKAGLVPYLATLGGGSPLNTVFVTSQTGDVGADGSNSRPFNPTSAAASHGGDPLAQALAAIPAPTNASEEDAQWTIYCMGGNYPPTTAVIATHNIGIFAAGIVAFGAGSWPIRQVSPPLFATSTPTLNLGGGAGSLVIVGNFGVGDGGVPQGHNINARGVQWTGFWTTAPGGQSGFVDVYLEDSEINGTNTALTTQRVSLINSRMGTASVFNTIWDIRGTSFNGNITVANDGGAIFYDCRFWSPCVFTGPADSARFDPDTVHSFQQAPGTFAGGAGYADYYNPRHTDRTIIADGAAGTVDAEIVWPNSTTLDNAEVVIAVPPSGAGTEDIDLLHNGVSILTAPIDATALVAGVPTSLPLVSPRPQLVRGDVLDFQIVRVNPIAGGLDYRFSAEGLPDNRPTN
jgi:hypothetical protein